MRSLFVTSALLSALAIPAAAHADTFSFTPTGGTAITFTLPAGIALASPGYYDNYILVPMAQGGQTTPFGNAAFYNPATENGLDFFINENIGGVLLDEYYNGPQLYSGTESAPVFIPGIYTLTAGTEQSDTATGVLIIDGGGAAVTPEPSSLILLGTGLVGAAGLARRRFFCV